MSRSMFALLTLAFVAACGSDSNGDGGNTTGPTIPDLEAQFCIRGTIQLTPSGTSRSGSLSTSDCHSGVPDDGYFEGYRVTVTSDMTVVIEVDSNFDSWLEVVRSSNPNDPVNSGVLIAQDDDSGVGLDARVSVNLTPGFEYFVFVSGYDDAQAGSYTLNFN